MIIHPMTAILERTKLPPHRYAFRLVRVIDGDTLEVNIDLGLRVHILTKLRLFGINCPEMNTPEGVAAKAFVIETFAKVGINTTTVEVLKEDKYGGRWNAIVYIIPTTGLSLNDYLVQAGHAVYRTYSDLEGRK